VIDHLGGPEAALPATLRLVEQGAKVKATRFGASDHDIARTLRAIDAVNPGALLLARTIALVEEGARRSDDGVAIVHEAAGAFAAIRDGIGEVDRQAEQIATAIATVERSAATMGADLSDVAAVAEQSSASTQQVSASAQQTSASTLQIAASAQELARQAARLDELVGQFTLA
jgi:methyl-accepting chemotaxis protein